MLHERIYLDNTDERVYIDAYVANDRSAPRNAMLVIPGGGYRNVCTDREGEPIALAFAARGYNCFVLNYRVSRDTDRYPAQLVDASRAIVYIKDNAERFNIDPERVFTVGFSAGGHLSGSCAVLHKEPGVLDALGIEQGRNKPRASILAYPVVTAMAETHRSSFEFLLGMPFDEIPEDMKKKMSLEEAVDSDTAPMFIWHTVSDALVPCTGSLMLATACYRRGVPVTLRLYPYGPHGLALSTPMTMCGNPDYVQPIAEEWVDKACEWIDTLK